MTKDFIVGALEAAYFTTAKTMPGIPHAYTLRQNWNNKDVTFDQAVQGIRDFGEPRHFYSKVYIYLDAGEWQYWTMGAPLKDTILINRARRQPNLFSA